MDEIEYPYCEAKWKHIIFFIDKRAHLQFILSTRREQHGG